MSINEAVMRWANSRPVSTKGEKPKSSPPRKAAGVQGAQRRSTRKAKKALRAGVTVEATFSEATGPQIQVTGTRGRLSPMTDVCDSRLIPVGWNSAVE